MLSQEENERFTRVSAGHAHGRGLRRYWQPVGCSEFVTSKPQRIKVLGEELVLYRGTSGAPVADAAALRPSQPRARLRPGRRRQHPLSLSRLAL